MKLKAGWQRFRDQGGMVVVLLHHGHIKKKKNERKCSKKQGGAPSLMLSLGGAIYFPAV